MHLLHRCMTCCRLPVAAAVLGPCMILLATGLWGCSPRSSGRGEPQQAWMNGRFPVAVKGSPEDAAEVAELEKMGVNAVFGNVSGDARSALKDKGILYFMNVSVFHDSGARDRQDLLAVDNHGSQRLDGWQTFVCPVREDYRSRKVAEIAAGELPEGRSSSAPGPGTSDRHRNGRIGSQSYETQARGMSRRLRPTNAS